MFKTPRVSSLRQMEQSCRYYLLFTSFSQDKIFFFFSPGPGGWRMWRLCSPRMYDSTINQYIQQKAAFIMLEDLGGSDLTANNPESYIFLNEDPFHLWPQTQRVSLWRQYSGYFSRLLQPYCLWEGQNGDFWKKKYKSFWLLNIFITFNRAAELHIMKFL